MLDAKMRKSLNIQVQEELFSAYLYLSMSAWATSINLKGVGHWFSVQAQEEMVHAMKIYNYIIERGGKVELLELKAPQTKWDSPLDAFKAAYKHEQHITGKINDLATLAIELKDHATGQFLHWFVAEQVEEEANADEIVQKLTLMKDAPGGLYMLDQELMARIALFTMPVTAAGA